MIKYFRLRRGKLKTFRLGQSDSYVRKKGFILNHTDI